MKQTKFAIFMAATLLFITTALHAQTKSDQIMKSVTDYFSMERENIHVQFDKNVFMTNESIWFKGYVFHRKKNIPFFNTINVFGSIMDADGKVLETKLIYGNIGSFNGSFNLSDKFKSGKYYVQFYTNWMNNFIEDESAVYEIAIVNPTEGAGTALAKADPSKIIFDITPEGGTLLDGVPSAIGFHIADCNQNPLPITTVDVVDASEKLVRKIQINKLGYGKFDLPVNAPKGYKAIVYIGDVKHEKAFPASALSGISIEVNNYAVADKTIIKVRTNKNTLDSFGGKPAYMLIHQDEKALVLELNLNTANFEQTLVIPNTDFAAGMNTIRIIDNNMSQLSERLFFNYPKTGLSANLEKTGETTDKLQYSGKVNYPNMNLSISVLPENTISFDDTNDIYGSFYLLPYIESKHKASGRHYFTTLSKGKLFELDLFLLSQKSKYQWHNIKLNPPKSNYMFDMGLTLKGTLPPNVDGKFGKVRLYSITSGIDEITDVNEKQEFYFKNLVVSDSSYVNFTLLKKGEKPKELTIAPQLLNGNAKFNKPYKPEPHFYAPKPIAEDIKNPNIYKETIQLDAVEITGKKNALQFANSFGNGDLRGYKITDDKANSYQNLLQFIKTYGGFIVDDRNESGEIRIISRTKISINAAEATPIIYLDNVQLRDLSMLSVILMGDVDEIYISSTKIIPNINAYIGMIKIYLKKGVRPGKKGSTTANIVLKNAFEKSIPFQNVTYNTVEDKGFDNFGVIDWEPNIMTDDKGEFKLAIPKLSSKPLKVLIEGFSADGKLISEIKTINNK